MNEHDFRDALRQTMTAEPTPPPMSDAPVLDAAHRDRGRRRAMWAGAASAAAVVAIAVGLVAVGPPGGEGVQVAGPAVQTTGTANPPSDTKTSWPNGQTDRTATSGPQADRGVALGAALAAVVPAGYESPDLTADVKDGGTYPLKFHQAQYIDTINGVEVWSYDASAPITKDGAAGQLSVNVLSPGLGGTGQGCDIAQAIGISEGSCHEVDVNGKKVGVIDLTVDGHQQQRAAYRFDDGTAVVIEQLTAYPETGMPALAGLPLTAEQLAALAVDDRFNVV